MDSENISQQTGQLRQEAQQTSRNFMDKAQEWQREATERVRNAAEATDGYIRDNPWEAIGWVAAAGFIIGFLLGRTRR